jgi:DNA-binding CsgD family transcriptional regulator/uncharacterized coiled-coil protein SlyX
MEPAIRPALEIVEKSHWNKHHPAGGYTKWMTVIDGNIVHTWINAKTDVILDVMDVDLLQIVLSESALQNKQFHILFDLRHVFNISFNYKKAIADLLFYWSPILGVIGFYNIPESMRIVVDTFASIAPETICIALTNTYQEAIEFIMAFKAGKCSAETPNNQNNNAEPALKKRFLEAIARISWLNMLDEQIVIPPPDNLYHPFFQALDSLRSDLIAKEDEKDGEIKRLKEDFEHRITKMVIKINAQTDVNKKSTRDLEKEIAVLTGQIVNLNIELIKTSKIITAKTRGLRDLLDKVKTLEIDPVLKNVMTNSCLSLIEKRVTEKLKDIEMSESDSLILSKLQKRFPTLTQRELKICLLIKLNYDTTEIARSKGLSTRGMESIRYRLHSKLGLEKHQSIKNYLSELSIE